MGNSGSSIPRPPPRIDVDSYPYQTPATTDSVSISASEECARCVLSVNRGTTTSSIRLERVFGPISKAQTVVFGNDYQDVKERKMSFQDFLRKLQSGGYYRPVNDNYAEQVMFLQSDLKDIKTLDNYDSNISKLQVTRIRKIAAGSVGYSEDTKLTIVPSAPFSYTFNGASVSVKTMSLYYPCPVRVENVQYDAVLSLGDPSDEDNTFVLLIPIRAVMIPNYATDMFFSKIASYIPGILHPKADASFDPVNVPTGSDWSISSILPVTGNAEGQPEVSGALYAWRGVPRKSITLYNSTIEPAPGYFWPRERRMYGWYDKSLGLTPEQRRSLPASRQYIMLAQPIEVGSATISAIQALPVTPPEQAIDGVPAKGVFYKSVICPSKKEKEKASSNKEHFDNGENCDPFSTAPTPPPVDPNFLFSIIMGMLGAIAMFVGIYFAVSYAGGPGANVVKGFGEYLARAYVMIKKTAKVPVATPVKAPSKETETKEDGAESRLSSPLREKVPTKARDTTARVRPKEIRSLDQYKNSKLTQRNPRVPKTRTGESKSNDEVTDAELADAAEARLAKSLNQPITIKATKAEDAAAGTGLLTPEQMRQAEAERVRMEREAKEEADRAADEERKKGEEEEAARAEADRVADEARKKKREEEAARAEADRVADEERKKKEEQDTAELARLEREHEEERKKKEEQETAEIARLEREHEEERQRAEAADEQKKARAREVLSNAVRNLKTTRARTNSLASTNESVVPSTPTSSTTRDDYYNPSHHRSRGVASYLKTDPESHGPKSWRIGQRLETFFRKAPFDLNVRAAVDYRKKDFEHEAGKALREQFHTLDEYTKKYGPPPPAVNITEKDGRLRVRLVGHGRDM